MSASGLPPNAGFYAFIPFEPAAGWEYEVAEFAGGQPAEFAPADLAPLEAALATAVARHNLELELRFGAQWQTDPDAAFSRELLLIDLPRYVRQVVTFQTPGGRRLVWVLLVRYPPGNWRTRPCWHEDGGNSFVSALYEPACDHLRWLRPSGHA